MHNLPDMNRVVLGLALALCVAAPETARSAGRKLLLTAVDSEPDGGRARPSDGDLAALRAAVEASPEDRQARFALVRGLIHANQLDDALEAARAWRNEDAYNLVVVRMMGDIYSEKGDRARALRTYSAVVELLPKDASAQRALASVLKQSGDLEAARERLAAASALRPEDMRLQFELADASHRLGQTDEARTLLSEIATNEAAPESIRYPAKQRLGQLLSEQRRAATAAGETERARALAADIDALNIKGGVENDIKIYLTWDTDGSDVDLWVTNPAGEKVFYSHREGKFGDALYDDVTSGYGPESFTAPGAQPGTYEVQVNYYRAAGGNFAEARGEVVVILNEGSDRETKQVLPYRLFQSGQTVTVARIEVK